MALKDQDFLLNNDKEIEKAMAKLGLVLEEEEKEFNDPTDRFAFDMSALENVDKDKKTNLK